MFVIRIAFWIALIVMVLPSDREQQARLYQTATETMHRAATFCDRNAKLCEQGGAALGRLPHEARVRRQAGVRHRERAVLRRPARRASP